MEQEIIANKERNCVIEILRIISMALIVCGHVLLYSGMDYGKGIESLGFLVMEHICKPAVNVFVIISGYFMLDSKFSIKRLLLIWGQIFFYSVSLYLLVIFMGGEDFSVLGLLKSLLPVSFNQYWYARVYIYLYLCSPFLNILLKRFTIQNYYLLFALGGLLMVIPSSIPGIASFNPEGGNGILWFIMLYCTGAYFYQYPIRCKARTGFVCVGVLLSFSMIMQIIISKISTLIGYDGRGASRFSTYDSFPIYGAAIGIFLMFLQISKKDIRAKKIRSIILFFSSSSFSVYLIHEHPSIRNLWDTLHISRYSGLRLYGVLIISVIGIFLVAVIVDKLTWNNVHRLLVKIKMDKIEHIIQKSLKTNTVDNSD